MENWEGYSYGSKKYSSSAYTSSSSRSPLPNLLPNDVIRDAHYMKNHAGKPHEAYFNLKHASYLHKWPQKSSGAYTGLYFAIGLAITFFLLLVIGFICDNRRRRRQDAREEARRNHDYNRTGFHQHHVHSKITMEDEKGSKESFEEDKVADYAEDYRDDTLKLISDPPPPGFSVLRDVTGSGKGQSYDESTLRMDDVKGRSKAPSAPREDMVRNESKGSFDVPDPLPMIDDEQKKQDAPKAHFNSDFYQITQVDQHQTPRGAEERIDKVG